jgi:uncharacterized UPF0146 family protein
MGEYKRIEICIGRYIASAYPRAVEAGIGKNTEAAKILADAGVLLRCTDIKNLVLPPELRFATDDLFSPDHSLYRGTAVIYAIRPAIEMIPPLIALARAVDCDLLVYHLGDESYGNGGRRIDCGVILHQYYRSQNPSRVD